MADQESHLFLAKRMVISVSRMFKEQSVELVGQIDITYIAHQKIEHQIPESFTVTVSAMTPTSVAKKKSN